VTESEGLDGSILCVRSKKSAKSSYGEYEGRGGPCFELLEMNTISNYFEFSEESIEKPIKPEMKGEHEKDNHDILTSEN